MKFHRHFILLFLSSLPIIASSQTEEEELLALMELLDEETALATQEKMNADFVPGMVSIIHGDDLKRWGVSNSGEALGMVPGMYITEGSAGQAVSVVRGVGISVSSSNLKLMLNGVPFNEPVSGMADPILKIPVEQIDRIEVIRGPGSSIYGEYAFSGVVNIITRQQESSVSLKGGSHNNFQGDFLLGSKDDSSIHWQLNLSAWQQDKSGVESGIDNFFSSNRGYSPSPVDDAHEGQMLLAAITLGEWQVRGQFFNAIKGGYHGVTAKAPDDYENGKERFLNLAMGRNFVFSDSVSFKLDTLLQNTRIENAQRLGVPAGIPGAPPPPPGSPGPPPGDISRKDAYQVSNFLLKGHLHWQIIPQNTLLIGYEYSYADVEKSWGYLETPVKSEQLPNEVLVLNGSNRSVSSILLQDKWSAMENLDFTVGLRWDDYDDWGSRTSPRAAAVWRINESHILKTQYAEAFRPPVLQEAYPGPNQFPGPPLVSDLKEEEITSTEVSYLYRKPERSLRLTVFETEIEDLVEFFIQPGQQPLYRNLGKIHVWGAEIEWEEHISRDLDIMANVSYLDSHDKDDTFDRDYTGSVQWLANLAFTWHMLQGLSHSLVMKYVGRQEGAELPNLKLPHVESFDAYHLVDYTMVYEDAFFQPGLELSAGIKNIGDREYQTQSYPTQWPRGLNKGDRTWHLGVAYQF